MRVIIDTNVIIAYLVSGSSKSTNYRVCQRVMNGNDKAFSCDMLYGELNRLLSLDPDLIQKIASTSNKEGKFFSSLEKVNPQYLNARLDPFVTQVTSSHV
ncbi:MAG: PIN domain-containing protein [Thermoplasmataceae archaeon]